MKKLILLLALSGACHQAYGLFSTEKMGASNNSQGKPAGSSCSKHCDCKTGLSCLGKVCSAPFASVPVVECYPANK